MAKQKMTELDQITNDWQAFSKTLAYQRFIEFIELQKQVNNIAASGPMEVYVDVLTSNGEKIQQFEFEPEKYAYLLQRSVGCDIVKMYVEDFTTPSA